MGPLQDNFYEVKSGLPKMLMDMQSLYINRQRGGGEAVVPPFRIVPYRFGKVGGVICHMYWCKKSGWHEPILVSYQQSGWEGLVEHQALVVAIIPGLTTYLCLFPTRASIHA